MSQSTQQFEAWGVPEWHGVSSGEDGTQELDNPDLTKRIESAASSGAGLVDSEWGKMPSGWNSLPSGNYSVMGTPLGEQDYSWMPAGMADRVKSSIVKGADGKDYLPSELGQWIASNSPYQNRHSGFDKFLESFASNLPLTLGLGVAGAGATGMFGGGSIFGGVPSAGVNLGGLDGVLGDSFAGQPWWDGAAAGGEAVAGGSVSAGGGLQSLAADLAELGYTPEQIASMQESFASNGATGTGLDVPASLAPEAPLTTPTSSFNQFSSGIAEDAGLTDSQLEANRIINSNTGTTGINAPPGTATLGEKLLKKLTDNPLALVGLAANAASSLAQRKSSGTTADKLNQMGAPVSDVAKDLLEKYKSGEINAGAAFDINTWEQQQINKAKNYFAKAGMSTSSSAVHAIEHIKAQATAMRDQSRQGLLTSGLQASQISYGPLTNAIQAQAQTDQAFSQSQAQALNALMLLQALQAKQPGATA